MKESTTQDLSNVTVYYGSIWANKTGSIRAHIAQLISANPELAYTIVGKEDNVEQYYFDEGYKQVKNTLRIGKNNFTIDTDADIIVIFNVRNYLDIGLIYAAAATGKQVLLEIDAREESVAQAKIEYHLENYLLEVASDDPNLAVKLTEHVHENPLTTVEIDDDERLANQPTIDVVANSSKDFVFKKVVEYLDDYGAAVDEATLLPVNGDEGSIYRRGITVFYGNDTNVLDTIVDKSFTRHQGFEDDVIIIPAVYTVDVSWDKLQDLLKDNKHIVLSLNASNTHNIKRLLEHLESIAPYQTGKPATNILGEIVNYVHCSDPIDGVVTTTWRKP